MKDKAALIVLAVFFFSFGIVAVTVLSYFRPEKRFIDATTSRRGKRTVGSAENARSAANRGFAFSI